VQHLQRAALNASARQLLRKGPQAFSSGQSRSWRKWVPTALPPSQPEGQGADAVGTKVQDGQGWKEPQHQLDAAHHNGTNGAVHASAPDAAAAAAGLAPIYDKGLPHRWRITFMMAVAFVLCNMDKVCHGQGLQNSLDLGGGSFMQPQQVLPSVTAVLWQWQIRGYGRRVTQQLRTQHRNLWQRYCSVLCCCCCCSLLSAGASHPCCGLLS
jgi:hypothetical protein